MGSTRPLPRHPNSAFQGVNPSSYQHFCGSQADSKVSTEDRLDTLKTTENPSKSAEVDGLTLQNGKNEQVEEEGHINSSDPDPELTSVADLARRLKRDNPTWSAKRIAAELGQPEGRIARYLA
jgi:hypothetical protein